jgi:hypothetical protein
VSIKKSRSKTQKRIAKARKLGYIYLLIGFMILVIIILALIFAYIGSNRTSLLKPEPKSAQTYGGLAKDQFLAVDAAEVRSKSSQAKTEIEKEFSALNLQGSVIAKSSVDVCYIESISYGWMGGGAGELKNCYYRGVYIIPVSSNESVASKAVYGSLINNQWSYSVGSAPLGGESCYHLALGKTKSLFSGTEGGLTADLFVGTPDSITFDVGGNSACLVKDQVGPNASGGVVVSSELFDEKGVREKMLAGQYAGAIRIGFVNEYYSKGLSH